MPALYTLAVIWIYRDLWHQNGAATGLGWDTIDTHGPDLDFFSREIRELLLPRLEHPQLARLGQVTDFQIEGVGVALASEVSTPLDATLTPADTPRDLAARMNALVDAHAATSEPESRRRPRSPFGAGARAGRGSGGATGSTWLDSIQRSTSSGVILSREQSFDARSSPRSMAR